MYKNLAAMAFACSCAVRECFPLLLSRPAFFALVL